MPDLIPQQPSAESEPQRPYALIVEDNPSVRMLLSHSLKNVYAVETAATVDEALAKASQRRYDILVLDINLCDTRDGVALLHEIRQDPSYRSVPAVACTAYVRNVERERFLAAGFEGYVSKPFTRAGLLEAMERVLASETEVVITPKNAPEKQSAMERVPVSRTEPDRVLVNGRVLRRLA